MFRRKEKRQKNVFLMIFIYCYIQQLWAQLVNKVHLWLVRLIWERQMLAIIAKIKYLNRIILLIFWNQILFLKKSPCFFLTVGSEKCHIQSRWKNVTSKQLVVLVRFDILTTFDSKIVKIRISTKTNKIFLYIKQILFVCTHFYLI